MVGFKRELDCQAAIVHAVAREVEAEHNVKLTYRVGAMIEVPRAALTADEIADRRILKLWHKRPDPDLPRYVARR